MTKTKNMGFRKKKREKMVYTKCENVHSWIQTNWGAQSTIIHAFDDTVPVSAFKILSLST